MIVFWYGLIVTFFWIILSIWLSVNRSRMIFLRESNPYESSFPKLVIIIPVRNDDEALAPALHSICKLDYPNFRIQLVNDRSTDTTGMVMKSFAYEYTNISIMTLTELPEGWLGKNHAMYRAYQESKEPWLLFTDADVIFQPDTLKKAIHYCTRNKLDHLALMPFVKSRSKLLNSTLATFMFLMEMRQRPWAASDPDSQASLGAGAFNLVRREMYEKIGTHKAIALRPDDDLKLGERIKQKGGRTAALYGEGQIRMEWYASVGEFIDGLMKNTFSIFNYQLNRLLLGGVLPMLFFFVLPMPVLMIYGDWTCWILVITLLFFQWLLLFYQQGSYKRPWFFLTIPISGLLMVYIMLRAGLLTLMQKGIYWRGQFHSLTELRSQT
jgi:cellulose synthase/poly-beta-1,6-N-acetylglucosamine synthase-like glycosyltransferase